MEQKAPDTATALDHSLCGYVEDVVWARDGLTGIEVDAYDQAKGFYLKQGYLPAADRKGVAKRRSHDGLLYKLLV